MAASAIPAPAADPVASPAVGGVTDSQVDAAFAPDTPDSGAEETPDETKQPELEAPSEVVEGDEEAVSEEVPEEVVLPTEKPVDPTVPEGVTVRDGKTGKKEWVLPESRGRLFHEAYKLKREAEQLFGEDITIESLAASDRSHQGQLQLQAHFLSGNPQYQDRVIQHFIKQGRGAVEAGEAAEDPMTSFSSRMPQVLLSENGPAFQAMRDRTLEIVLPAIMREAAASGDPSAKALILSAQHLQNYFFGKYDTTDSIGKAGRVDDLSARQADLDRREAEIKRINSSREAERTAAWKTTTRKENLASIETSVAGVISEEVKNGYKSYPENFEALKDRLRSRVIDSIRSDTVWQSQIERLKERALLSQSEQTRADITAQIANMHRIKATGILESIAPPIISEFTRLRKEKSDAVHARRAEAATHREPGGGGPPIHKSIVPAKPSGDSSKTFDEWSREIDALDFSR